MPVSKLLKRRLHLRLRSCPEWRPSLPREEQMRALFPFWTRDLGADLIRMSLKGGVKLNDVRPRILKLHSLDLSQETLNSIGLVMGIPIPGMGDAEFKAAFVAMEREVEEYQRKKLKAWVKIRREVDRVVSEKGGGK